MSLTKNNFKQEILTLQKLIKEEDCVFIYYKELVEILRQILNKPISLEEEIIEILSKDYLPVQFFNQLSSLTKEIVKEHKYRNRDRKVNDQITLSKDTLKTILSKYYKVEINSLVISTDYEKIFLKIVVP